MNKPHRSRRRRGVPPAPAVGVLACLLACTAHATPASAPDALALPPGSTQGPLGAGMRLYGMPADIRLVDIPLPIAQAVPALTQRYPMLSDLGVYPGFAILSGQAASQMWLAALEAAGPGRTRGSVTVLNLAGGAHIARRPSWLPGQANLRLDFSDHDGDRLTLHQVWTLPLPVSQARQAAAQGLRRDGWQCIAGAGDAEHCTRGHASLDIAYAAVDGGSGVLLQQHQKDTP